MTGNLGPSPCGPSFSSNEIDYRLLLLPRYWPFGRYCTWPWGWFGAAPFTSGLTFFLVDMFNLQERRSSPAG